MGANLGAAAAGAMLTGAGSPAAWYCRRKCSARASTLFGSLPGPARLDWVADRPYTGAYYIVVVVFQFLLSKCY